jgi:hypothetical protein
MKREKRTSETKRTRKMIEAESEQEARAAEAEELLRSLRGKLHWEGDLKAMRRDRK